MATTPAADDDVEKILTGIMSKQSPLMKQARTQGLQGAQQAGLGQSTMGIKAAQAAAYNAALPIASQEAQQRHQKSTQQAGFGHETGMQQAEFGQQTEMQGTQIGHEKEMQTAGFGHASSESAKDRQQQETLAYLQDLFTSRQLHTQAGLERGTIQLQQAHDAGMRALDRSSTERLAAAEMNAQDRERALSAMSQFNAAFMSSYSQLIANENIPADAKSQLMAHIDNYRIHNQNLTETLYGHVVNW